MQVKILKESGYEEALLGMSLSYYDHQMDVEAWWDDSKQAKARRRAAKLAHMEGGHNKMLESITVSIYIQAARSFWSEFDTYRVGMTKNSSSTMHTLDKRLVTKDDFEAGTDPEIIASFNKVLTKYWAKELGITELKDNLPEGWLQERVVVTNYKTLRNIISQRLNHRLRYWKIFSNYMLDNLAHPEFIITKPNLEEVDA